MAPYVLVLALSLAALAQVSLMPALHVAGVYPHLPLVVIAAWALLRGARAAAIWALIAGLWLDLLSGGPFGVYTLGLIAAAFVVGWGGRAVYRPHLLLALALVAAATLVHDGVQMLSVWIGGGTLSLPDTFLRLVLPQIAYNAVIMAAIYPLLSWAHRFTGQERLPLE